jgi:uncharacterized membrane protein YqjE
MSEATPGGNRGLFESLTIFAGTLVTIVQTRLDLLSEDLEEERVHLFSMLLLSLVALMCLVVGVVLAIILIVVTFWDTHRLLALAVISGFFLACSLVAWLVALRKARSKPRLFAASLSELSKDRQQLTSRS